MKSLLALLILGAALVVGGCNSPKTSTAPTLAPVVMPGSSSAPSDVLPSVSPS